MEVTRNTFRMGWGRGGRVGNKVNCVTGMLGRALNAGRIQTTTKCELNTQKWLLLNLC